MDKENKTEEESESNDKDGAVPCTSFRQDKRYKKIWKEIKRSGILSLLRVVNQTRTRC